MHLLFLSQSVPDTWINVSQLGIAGLMGGLWWWERRYSRLREDQLTSAHEVIMGQREHLDVLLGALQQNTKAITSFTEVQQELMGLLEHQTTHPAAAAT